MDSFDPGPYSSALSTDSDLSTAMSTLSEPSAAVSSLPKPSAAASSDPKLSTDAKGASSSPPSEAEDLTEVNVTEYRTKKGFLINKNWTEEQWRSFTHGCRVSLYEIFRVLGIHPPGKEDIPVANGLWKFKDPNLLALSTTISDVVRKRSDDFATREELAEAAADSYYLEEDIDAILDQHGLDVWGQDVKPREGQMVRLVYEDEDDRQMIRLHLHQWTFLKLCNHMRESVMKKGKSKKGKKRPSRGSKGPVPVNKKKKA